MPVGSRGLWPGENSHLDQTKTIPSRLARTLSIQVLRRGLTSSRWLLRYLPAFISLPTTEKASDSERDAGLLGVLGLAEDYRSLGNQLLSDPRQPLRFPPKRYPSGSWYLLGPGLWHRTGRLRICHLRRCIGSARVGIPCKQNGRRLQEVVLIGRNGN
jgi:hypothetical protein